MLKDKIRTDFSGARKSGDTTKRMALEAIVAAILQKEKMKVGTVITDAEVLDCLTKEIKVQQEIQEMYQGKDNQKSEESKLKIEILQFYLPKQLTEQEVLAMIKELDIYDDTSNRTKGMIIKTLMPQINGKYDKSKVNPLVEGYLATK